MSTYAVSMLSSSTILDLATAPANGDTITIQGVTFTFVTTIGIAAGNVLIGTAAQCNTYLTALINAPGTTTAQGVALSADDQAILEAISAVATATTTAISSKNGSLMASSSMTTGANDFQVQVVNACIMEKGAIKMALRNGVKVESRDEPLKLVTNYFIFARYGLKVTTRSKERMVVIPLVSQVAES